MLGIHFCGRDREEAGLGQGKSGTIPSKLLLTPQGTLGLNWPIRLVPF